MWPRRRFFSGQWLARELLLVIEDKRTARKMYRTRDDARPTSSIILSASTIRSAGIDDRIFEPMEFERQAGISLSGCQQNRVQLIAIDPAAVSSDAIRVKKDDRSCCSLCAAYRRIDLG